MNTSKVKKKSNVHRGSSLEDFLKTEGIYDEVRAEASKRALALALGDLMEKQKIKKTTMASRMGTSRTAVNRLLDPRNSSVTLATLCKAAQALGQKLKIELVPA